METLSIRKSLNNRRLQKLKINLGKALSIVFPVRTNELFENPVCQPKGIRDKSIMAFLKHRASEDNQVEFFDRFHKDVWKNQEGVFFAQNCESRFKEMSLKMQREEFDLVIKICKNAQPKNVVEIGCNSGPVLNFLTQSIDGLESAIGIDINEEQIQKNRTASNFDSRIHFVAGDGFKWVLENGKANTLFITNGGVLEYFPRKRLDEMLSHISSTLDDSIFFAVEPIAQDHDWATSCESIPFGEELSFSHNYKDAFESNGFRIIHQRPVVFEKWKMMATIAMPCKKSE